MPTSARWEVANFPQISVKPVHSAGGQSRPPLQERARVVVGADDSVGPMRSYEFSENYRKNASPLRRHIVRVGEIGRHTGVVFDGVRVDALYGAPFEKRLAEERVQVLHGAVEVDLLLAHEQDRVGP